MSEYVLPCTYCGKCLGAGGNLATGLAAHDLDHRRLRTAQEGIGPLLQGQRGGQGDLTIPAQVFHYLQTYADVRVVRFHRLGKAQVGLGVFMGAIYGGGVRQAARRWSESCICAGVPSKTRPEPPANRVSPLSSQGSCGSSQKKAI